MAGNNLQLQLEGLTRYIEMKQELFEKYQDPELKEILDIAVEQRGKLLIQLEGRG